MPLREGTDSGTFRTVVASRILPAVDAFGPELILISAGFDAHHDEALAGLELVEDDYAWSTDALLKLASSHARARVVSVHAGGYALPALSRSVAAHVRSLMTV
ncbi:MAG: hypothetical protein FJ189_10135 [Gammaproteobacteria bacterium]|nr:hypothetical protein [Gammaproteobacteria bacterium]